MSVPCDARPAPHLRARVLAIALGAARSPLDTGVGLAHLLARAGAGERRVLWTLALPWLPGRIEAASLERPGLGDGWLLDERGTPIPNGAFPIELARAVLDLRDDDPVILIRQHRHPARSLRGAIRYMDRLWLLRHQLDLHARRLAPSAVERVQATA